MTPLILVVPLLIYIAASFSVPRKSDTTPANFFLASQRSSTLPFSNSSVAYAFQVATIYPFLTWAVAGDIFVPVLNAIAWGLGILLFSFTVHRLRDFAGTNLSLHGYLAAAYKSRTMQVLTSGTTLVGLLGVALAEIVWGSQAVAVVLEGSEYTYAVVTAMALTVFAYISYGGQPSSLRTDQLQLVFSYIGVMSLLGILFARASRLTTGVAELTKWCAAAAAGYVIVLLILRRGRILARTDQVNSFGMLATRASNILVFAAFVGIVGTSLFLLPPQSSPLQFVGLESFGHLGVASMILLPLGFQFVDMTNWQRLLSLPSGSERAMQSARHGLRLYSIESPFTWVVFLMIGAAAVEVFPSLEGSSSVLTDLPLALFAEETVLGYWSAVLFLISILAIMLSTVDSVLMAVMFTFVSDIRSPQGWKSVSSLPAGGAARAMLWQARGFGGVLLVLGVAMYAMTDWAGASGDQFIGALFAFYSAQLAMLPLVLGALFLREVPPARLVLPALVMGAGCGVGIGLYATFARPDLQWWPIPVCLLVSFGLYGAGALIHRGRVFS